MAENLAESRALRERLSRYISEEGGDDQVVGFGVGHLTFVASNLEQTASFYADVLGFPVVRVEPWSERPESTQLFFDIGGGCQLAFVDLPAAEWAEHDRSFGAIHHLAIRMPESRLNDLISRMVSHGIPFDGPIRKEYTSAYVRDPDGILLELMSGLRIPSPGENP